ncbi:MAG: hypothetical protein Q4B70_11360 [Lachnospiraceae bacterium]|nr:hypothetical protein [Lachnospiraceae bacterium]
MEKGKTIAVTGKGGAGKSIIASLMISQLAKQYPNEILAIDADSAMSLPYTLGIDVDQSGTITAMRRAIVGYSDVKKKMNNKPMREVIREVVHKGDGFDLLLMGRPEEPGCYCAVNDLLRHGMDMLVQDYKISIVDGAAGPEQINRRVLKDVDTLLVVSDMSARSLETARGIVEIALANENGISVRKAGLVLNRVRDDEPLHELVEKVGVPVIGKIPEDGILNKYDREGKTLRELPEDVPSVKAVQQILQTIIND